jgi:acetyltransferase-like isoleucine patch superfamily enzyme
MDNKGFSITFRVFNKLGIINDKQKYGHISLFGIVKHFFVVVRNSLLFKRAYKPGIFETRKLKKVRSKLWRKMGCNIGQGVQIGHSVSVDCGNMDLLTIEDNVIITNCCILLMHRRDMSYYYKGDEAIDLPYIYKPIVLKKGCQIGMGSIIMPGVTIGEGAIIGARSVVSRDIPAWTIAVGSPCKVIKEVPSKQE